MDSIEWAAGLFEGEGSISIATIRGRHEQVTVKVTMTDKDIIDRFAAVMGCGTVTTATQQQPHHKRQWTWRVQSKSGSKMVIERLLPFLGERRRTRALEALPYCEYVDTTNKGDTHYLARLRSDQIPQIRARLAASEPCSAIAKDFGVSEGTIYSIKSGRNWKGY